MSLKTSSGKRKAEDAALEGDEVKISEDAAVKAEEKSATVEEKRSAKEDKVGGKTADSEDPKSPAERPMKKAKAIKEKPATNNLSAQDAIQAALSRVPKAPLSDYEKCSIFPQKLMQLLKNDEAPDAIWWLDDGESFAIEQENFTRVMNKVSRTSKKQVKLDSILRNLYRWGFKKLKDRDLPPNVLAYSHPKFKRDARIEMQTFSKKNDPPAATTPSISDAQGPPASALARALSARAQAGYGDNWNEEGAADKSMIGASVNPYAAAAMMGHHQQYAMMMHGADPQRMMFLMQQQQQQQQRQLLLQQELMFHEQQQRQALLFEAAAAEQAYAAQQRYGARSAPGASGGYPGFPHNPYSF